MKHLPLLFAFSWMGLWYTPDQLGQHYFNRGEFDSAANAFRDPLWKGVAEFRAGDFKQAAQSFSRVNTADGHYNQGNSWVMLGKYEDAVASYNKALKERPDWSAARENRDLAQARAEMLEKKGGNMTEGELGADKFVFDKNKKSGDEFSEIAGGEKLSDAGMQALWLRKVQTRPADFLRSKFAYQDAQRKEGDTP